MLAFLKNRKTLGALGVLGVFLLIIFRKKTVVYPLGTSTDNQKKAYKTALIIKSALGVQTGFWSRFTEDEKTVIEQMNKNLSIQNLVFNEYKKLTGNDLFKDISNYLNADEIKQINFYNK